MENSNIILFGKKDADRNPNEENKKAQQTNRPHIWNSDPPTISPPPPSSSPLSPETNDTTAEQQLSENTITKAQNNF